MASSMISRGFCLSLAAILLLLIIFINSPTSASASSAARGKNYAFSPWAKYYINFQNGFSKPGQVLELNCTKWRGKKSKTLPPQHIPQNGDWGWDVRRSIYVVRYICDYRGLGQTGQFQAWVDDPDFLNVECGGRHCTWRAQDDAFYLFNDRDRLFHKKFKL